MPCNQSTSGSLYFWKRLCDGQPKARSVYFLTNLLYANRQAIGLCLCKNYSIIRVFQRARRDDAMITPPPGVLLYITTSVAAAAITQPLS